VSLINECKVGDVAPVHLKETYRICVGIAPLILTLDFMELSGQYYAVFDIDIFVNCNWVVTRWQ